MKLLRAAGARVLAAVNLALRPLGYAVVSRREVDSIRVHVDELKRQNTRLLADNAALSVHATRLGNAIRRVRS